MAGLDCIAQTEVLCAGARDEWFGHWWVGEFCHRMLAKEFQQFSRVESCSWFKEKKKSKGWEDIYHAIHHQTFLKSQCQQVEANDAIIFPFNVHSAYLVQCRVQGRGFSWDFTAEIMQVHLAKIQVEAFFTQFSGTSRLLFRLWQKQEQEHFYKPLSKSQARQKDKRDQGANQEKWMAI